MSPKFIRQLVEGLRAVSPKGYPTSLAIRGSLALDKSPLSVTARDVITTGSFAPGCVCVQLSDQTGEFSPKALATTRFGGKGQQESLERVSERALGLVEHHPGVLRRQGRADGALGLQSEYRVVGRGNVCALWDLRSRSGTERRRPDQFARPLPPRRGTDRESDHRTMTSENLAQPSGQADRFQIPEGAAFLWLKPDSGGRLQPAYADTLIGSVRIYAGRRSPRARACSHSNLRIWATSRISQLIRDRSRIDDR